jgi:hypothetical protein
MFRPRESTGRACITPAEGARPILPKVPATREAEVANQGRRVTIDDDPQEQPSVPEEAIRDRAHQLYEQRGSEPGHDLEDWLQAERELQTEREPIA